MTLLRNNLKYFSDIRLWIAFFFLIRLYGITNLPLEISHNWRQSLTAMASRNFLETDNNIFFPRLDTAGDKTGIAPSGFPLLDYIHFLVSVPFGYEFWFGRLINLVVSSFGIWYFFLLVKRVLDERAAFFSALFLCTSIWFSFSRKLMPDTFSCSLVIASLHFACGYLEEKRRYQLLLFFLLFTLGVLCKLPAICLAGLLAVPFFQSKAGREKVLLVAAGLVSLPFIAAWYFYWVPFLVRTYEYQLIFPKGIFESIRGLIGYFPDTMERFYFTSFYSYVAFLLFVSGFIVAYIRRDRSLFYIFLPCALLFSLFLLKTGMFFSTHNYYIIPFVPAMAIFSGYAVAQIRTRQLAVLLLVIALGEAMANQQHDFRIREDELYKAGLEQIADRVSSKGDLIAVNNGMSTQMMFLAHRKGWSANNKQLSDPEFINDIRLRNCKVVIVDKHHLDDFVVGALHEKVLETADFVVFKP